MAKKKGGKRGKAATAKALKGRRLKCVISEELAGTLKESHLKNKCVPTRLLAQRIPASVSFNKTGVVGQATIARWENERTTPSDADRKLWVKAIEYWESRCKAA